MEIIATLQAYGLPPGLIMTLVIGVLIYRDVRKELTGIRDALTHHVLGTEGRLSTLEARVDVARGKPPR